MSYIRMLENIRYKPVFLELGLNYGATEEVLIKNTQDLTLPRPSESVSGQRLIACYRAL